MPHEVVDAVKNMRKAFHVLYLFDFDSAEAQAQLTWYKANIEQVNHFSSTFNTCNSFCRFVLITVSILEREGCQTIFINSKRNLLNYLTEEGFGNTVVTHMKP